MPKDEYTINSFSPGERLLLLYDYLLKHTNKDHVVPMKKILNYLETYDIFVSNKTIYIDFDKLKTSAGINIVYSAKGRGYYVENPPFDPYELRLLVDSIQSSKFITQDQARKITKKIKGLADVHTAETLNRQSYVPNRVRSMNDSVVMEADRLHECIALNCKVSFKFFHYGVDKKKQYANKGKPYVVSPYALLWNDGNYYLYAYVAERERFQHFRVDRMERIFMVPEDREGKEAFKTKDLTARQTKVFNMFSGEEYTVRLRCINVRADAILDRFGKDTILVPDDSSHFTTSVQVEVSEQFFAWVASFGRGVKIVSPPPVVQQMKEFAERLAEMYKDEG